MSGPSQSMRVGACCRGGVSRRCIQGKTLYMFEQFGVGCKLYVEVTLCWWRIIMIIIIITFCQESPQMLCAKFGPNGWYHLGGVCSLRRCHASRADRFHFSLCVSFHLLHPAPSVWIPPAQTRRTSTSGGYRSRRCNSAEFSTGQTGSHAPKHQIWHPVTK